MSLMSVKSVLGPLKCILAARRFPKCRMFGPRSIDQLPVSPLQTLHDLAGGIHHRGTGFLLGQAEKRFALLGATFGMARLCLVALYFVVSPIDLSGIGAHIIWLAAFTM